MIVYTPSNPCPSCGKHNGCQGLKCTNCQTVGCTNGTCKHAGTREDCLVCKKRKTKVRL